MNFSYYILNYIHSSLLGEKINVGILFYFEHDGTFVFKYPSKVKRLKEFYGDFQEWQLKSSLRAIEEKVWRLNNEGAIFSIAREEKKSIEEILRTDSTVLQFSSEKKSFSEHNNIESICDSYYLLYFTDYKANSKRIRHDEEYLIRSFKQRLIEKKGSAANLLKKDTLIKTQRTSVKFEYEWHNGRPNLIKPVSFDLEDERDINLKAILLQGQLNYISIELAKKNFHVDLIISPPSIDSSKLYDAYKNAVGILGESNADKSLVEENRLENYIDHVAKEIHAPVYFPTIQLPGIINKKELPPSDDEA